MQQYLVVANRTLGGQHLMDAIRQRLEAGPCRFHVVVPTTHVSEHGSYNEGHSRAEAQKRLDAALARFGELGAEVTGELGDASPVAAIRDALRHRQFDEIILSTFPSGASRWLRLDLPHRVARDFNVPVTHVLAEDRRLS
jgi:nucleotide-binding universal stress UspA family protein